MAIIRYIAPYKKMEHDPSPIMQRIMELDEKRCERAWKKYKEGLKLKKKQPQ